jgi:hypothetical protein
VKRIIENNIIKIYRMQDKISHSRIKSKVSATARLKTRPILCLENFSKIIYSELRKTHNQLMCNKITHINFEDKIN